MPLESFRGWFSMVTNMGLNNLKTQSEKDSNFSPLAFLLVTRWRKFQFGVGHYNTFLILPNLPLE